MSTSASSTSSSTVPENIGQTPPEPSGQAHRDGDREAFSDHSLGQHHTGDAAESSSQIPPRLFPTRRCRFCWADVEPTIEMPAENLPFFIHPKPRVTYVDDDPDLGELIKPCLCKGTRRYVHEGCLREMRQGMMRTRGANWERHYYECDICHFKYRLERMRFARVISNRLNQMILTIFALFLLTFALGFAADPILNMYLEPVATVAKKEFLARNTIEIRVSETIRKSKWGQHFAKGLASVGVLSFVNALTTITSPWQWWNIRNSFLHGSGRSGTTGRDRVASISWIVLVVGVLTALWKIYALIHYFAARYLLNVSDRVKNITLDDDDEDIKSVHYEHPTGHSKSE